MAKMYFLNEGTKTLHKVGSRCPQSKMPPPNVRYFNTIDEAVSYAQRYFHYCKNCFKEEKTCK